MGVQFSEESPAAIWDELRPLIAQNQSETGWHDDLGAEPVVEPYESAHELGAFRCYTARDDSLIGYSGFWIAPHPHYRPGTIMAFHDVTYLDPSHRGWIGIRLIRYCEDRLRELGVLVAHQTVSPRHHHGRLLERLGYTITDITYAKRLD